ncbi:hypothetical protein Tco_0426006 [Tanacetum coccineum]
MTLQGYSNERTSQESAISMIDVYNVSHEEILEDFDFLLFPECDSLFYEDFSEVDALPSTDNEDKIPEFLKTAGLEVLSLDLKSFTPQLVMLSVVGGIFVLMGNGWALVDTDTLFEEKERKNEANLTNRARNGRHGRA